MTHAFVIVQFKIYQLAQPARWRLFRPNIPAVPETERWVHYKLPHNNPDALVQAKPAWLSVGGLDIPTYSGNWRWCGDYGVWYFDARAESERRAFTLPVLSSWCPGRYRGEPAHSYRREAAQ